MQHTRNLITHLLQLRRILCSDITEVCRQHQLCLYLIQRSSRLRQERPKQGIRQPPMSFSNIAWHRDSGSPKLCPQAEISSLGNP
jgi:hypothetical protein